MFMGVVGLKDYFGEVGAIHGKAKEAKTIYEQTLNDIVDGTKKIDDAYTELHNFAEEQEAAKTGKDRDPYYDRVYDVLKDNPDALEAFAKRETQKTDERFDARNGRITEGKLDTETNLYMETMADLLKGDAELLNEFTSRELQHFADVKLEARPKDFTPKTGKDQDSYHGRVYDVLKDNPDALEAFAKREAEKTDERFDARNGRITEGKIDKEYHDKMLEALKNHPDLADRFITDELQHLADVKLKARPKDFTPIDAEKLEVPEEHRASYELHELLSQGKPFSC
jgi:hypothetical protein